MFVTIFVFLVCFVSLLVLGFMAYDSWRFSPKKEKSFEHVDPLCAAVKEAASANDATTGHSPNTGGATIADTIVEYEHAEPYPYDDATLAILKNFDLGGPTSPRTKKKTKKPAAKKPAPKRKKKAAKK